MTDVLDALRGAADVSRSVMATGSAGDFAFFKLIMNHVSHQVSVRGADMLLRFSSIVSAAALTLLTLWIMIQGYRIVTGRSRDSMMALVTNTGRACVIVSVAMVFGATGDTIKDFVTGDMKQVITFAVTGKNESAEAMIDRSLAYMQLAMSSIDAIDVVKDEGLSAEKTRALYMVGLGIGGPAVTAGSMLLLYEVAMMLFIAFGPVFIICLLFDQTRSLFQRWLLYGIGTMFSMAVLAFMVSIALDMVLRVTGVFWAVDGLGAVIPALAAKEGFTSQAMQQGGMGLILTTLILTAPPMAAMFFQGTLGSFMAYSQIGGGPAAVGPRGEAPGSYVPSKPTANRDDSEASTSAGLDVGGWTNRGAVTSPGASSGRRGLANE